eukprot:TRINITY_DN2679_c0_g1_i1.p1 TRINITY_DN2679_c0_g1~~TRINITY_DN2679_c0_g1_i1.p1  ORF type:complete len:141 (-),score=29.02 TRINITY_DN2679_c0_g1_i1:234-656(-)
MESFSQKKPTAHNPHHQTSTTNLMSSAKVVAEAAQSTLHHQSDKLDKGKVAGAAADLLGAVSHYGKLEEKSFGKYIDKAEDYLHNYNSSHSSTTTITTTHSTVTNHSTQSSSTHSGGGNAQSESGYGEYFKMAEGFLKKH